MKGAWQWVAAGLIIFILFYYFMVPVQSESGVGAEVTVVYTDGSSETFSGGALDRMQDIFMEAITLPGDNRQVERFIIHIMFTPDITGNVISWSFKAEVGVWLWYDRNDEENLVTTQLSDSGSSLKSGTKYDVGSITILASTIEQKLNNRNAQEGTYALIVKLKYAQLSVEFDTGVSDTFEISHSTWQSILTIEFNFTGDKINRVDVEARATQGFMGSSNMIAIPLEVVTSEV